MKGLSSLTSSIDAVSCSLPPDKRAAYFFQIIFNAVNRAEFGMISDREKESIIQDEFKKLLDMKGQAMQNFRDELILQGHYFLLYSLLEERFRHLDTKIQFAELTILVSKVMEYDIPAVLPDAIEEYIKERNEILSLDDTWQKIEEKTGYMRPTLQAAGVQV